MLTAREEKANNLIFAFLTIGIVEVCLYMMFRSVPLGDSMWALMAIISIHHCFCILIHFRIFELESLKAFRRFDLMIAIFWAVVAIAFISSLKSPSPFFPAVLSALFILGYFYEKGSDVIEIEEKHNIAMQERSGDYGRSDYATIEEFKRINQPNPSKPGLWMGGYFYRSRHAHFVTIAPPREGKGTTLIIPNLLQKPIGSYVVTDPKGENACITARAQKEYGQKVYILDPWDLQKDIGAKHGIEPCGFNPFDALRSNPRKLPDNCQMIAHYLVPQNPNAREPFWENRARSMIKILLVHILTARPIEEHNFWTLYKLLRVDRRGMAELLVEMGKNDAYDGLVSAASKEIYSLLETENTYGGVLTHAHDATTIFESPELRRSLMKSEFNPYDLPNGDCTLYICIPEDYLVSHSAYLKIVMGLCLKAVNNKANKQVNFFIDEAAVLGHFNEIPDIGYAFGAGQNIYMWTFWHSIGAIKKIYGDSGANDIIGKSRVFQVFGINDLETAKHISETLGNKTRVKYRESNRPEEQGTYESFDYPLTRPEEILDEPKMICFAEGKKIKVERIPYFRVKAFEGKHDPPPRLYV